MSREVMKQALEVLEALHGGCTDSDDETVEAITVWCPEVIEALRAALDAPPVLWYHPLSGRVRFEETSKWIPLFK